MEALPGPLALAIPPSSILLKGRMGGRGCECGQIPCVPCAREEAERQRREKAAEEEKEIRREKREAASTHGGDG